MSTLLQDMSYGLRLLRKSPGFTALAVIALALGIGANSAIFSLVNAVLLKPLPYKHPGQLVMMWEQNPHRGWYENIVSGANFLDWKKQNHVFEDMAAFESSFFGLTGGGKAEEVAGERVTTNLFSVIGARPLHGRLFISEEETKGRAAVILSYGLWQRRYAGDPAVVGKDVVINGESYPVVGILPSDFSDVYSASAPHSQIWVSGIEPFSKEREAHEYQVLGRLRPGVTLSRAQTEMDLIASRLEQQYPDSRGWGVALVQLHDQVVEYTRPALLVLLGAVALVLLIACANVANLLLVRATAREKEIAMRVALGATRGRIVRQLLAESILLSAMGAGAGLAFAAWGSEILVRLSPPETPRLEVAGISGLVVLFTVLVAIGTGVLFGLAPALGVSNPNLNDALKASARSSTAGAKGRRLRDALVVCEFGLALALLVAAGLTIKALTHLGNVDLGFNPSHLVSLKVSLNAPRYRDTQRQAEFFTELLRRIEALPGVEAASISRGIPMQGWTGWDFVTADHPNPPAGETPDANYLVIAPQYFRTMQIPLLEGRSFTHDDNSHSQPVAIVSEVLARKYWPGQNPIGKRLKLGSDANDKDLPWLSIVGVAGNVRTEGQYALFLPEIYVPYTQYSWILWPRHLLVRTAGDPLAIVPVIRREVAALDKDVPVSEVSTMQEVVAGPVQQGHTLMWLLGGFAALALVLAAIGIYSVIAYTVRQRTHEIGIRAALGATHYDVISLVVRHSMLLTITGIAAGSLGALAMARFFSTLPLRIRWLILFDVRPTDPLIFAAVSVILTGIALMATLQPARQASRVDPMVALRYE